MKKITLLLTFMLASIMGCYGQASGYGFSANAGTFIETSASATVLPLVRADTYISPAQNIGFNFVYEGITYTQFKMSSNGFISFNMAGTSSLTTNDFATANATSRPVIAPLWDDLDGATPASSVASYEVTGTSPNQVLTVEWRNWEWNYGSSTPVISFQVKLYETTNVIEFVYRQEATAVASGSASIGIGSATGSAAGSYLNVTSIATPAVSSGTTVTNLNAKPTTGQIYRWTPPTCFAPLSLTVSNITTTDATISWSVPSVTPSSGYEYYYSTSNVTPTGAGVATSNLTEILTPLSSGTDYYVWMRSNCGSGDFSAWTGPITFKTVCAAFAVPSLENFTTYVPNCWQEADNGDLTAGPATFGASTWIADGLGNVGTTGAFRYNVNAATANDWILSPLYTIPAAGYELKFDAAATQTGATTAPTTPWESDDFVEVLISTGTTNWTVLYTYNDTNLPSNTGTPKIIDLDAYAGQNVRFAYRAFEGASNGTASIDFSVDNFELRLTPSCPTPMALAYSNLTANTVDLNWTAGASETNWEYTVLPSASPVPTSGTAIGTASVVGVTVSPATTYTAYVRAVCGLGDNSTWTTVTFTTPCVSVTAFVENFNSVTVPALPVCWSKVGTTGSVSTQTANNNSAPNTLYFYATSATNQAVVKTPSVSNLGAGTHRVRFNMRANSTVGGVVEIGYLTNPTDATTFVSLGSVTAASLTYSQYAFVPPAGTYTDYLALRHIGVPAYSVLIDDVVWEAIPTGVPSCSVVTTPANGSINQNVATNLFWSSNVDATGYKLSIGSTPGGTEISNNVDLGNEVSYNPSFDFAPGTTYYVLLIAYNASGDAIGCTETSFTTSTPPVNDACANAITLTPGGNFASYAVTGTVVGASTVTGLTYTCQTNRSDDVWYSVVVPASGTLTIETQANGASLLTDTVVSVFSGTCGVLTEVGCDDDLGTGNFSLVTLTGQTPGATLYIGVWKYGTQTNDTFKVSAYDASLGTNSFDNTNFSYYPNPVKDVLNLSYNTEISSIRVFNLLGQEVITKTINADQSQIDMSHLSAGAYVVQVTANDQIKMIKVVKE